MDTYFQIKKYLLSIIRDCKDRRLLKDPMFAYSRILGDFELEWIDDITVNEIKTSKDVKTIITSLKKLLRHDTSRRMPEVGQFYRAMIHQLNLYLKNTV